MAELTVKETAAGAFLVEIGGVATPTSHRVTVAPGLVQQVTGSGASDSALVEASFRFLLQREPNTSILRNFSIDVIGEYFPEWRSEMKKELGS
jgi:hypothetical protein